MVKKTYVKILGLISGMADKAVQDALLNMQESLDYCMEENRVLREELWEKHGVKRLLLSKSQKRRLAVKAKALGKHIPVGSNNSISTRNYNKLASHSCR